MATSYTKTNWQDAPSTATPITAAQLNRMEKGIEDCSGQGNANELAIAANAEAIQTLESGIQLGSISITQLLLMAHPIGSIYSSTAATSPADLFGGTWEQLYNEAAYVIEEGTSDIWSYRKWSDGTAECWGRSSISGISTISARGTYYYNSQVTVNYPSGFFSSKPVPSIILSPSVGFAFPSDATSSGSKDFAEFFIVTPNEGTSDITVYYSIHAIGKWSTEVDNTPKYVWKRAA